MGFNRRKLEDQRRGWTAGRLSPRYSPNRKQSPKIINGCAECTDYESAANEREQHGRFHAVDLLPVDVKLVCEVGHGYSPCNTLPHPFAINLTL